MGIESLHPRQTFGLEELGLFDGVPSKPIDTVVGLLSGIVDCAGVAFVVFDDRAAMLIVRAVSGMSRFRKGRFRQTSEWSALRQVREEAATVTLEDLVHEDSGYLSFERRAFGAVGFIGAPVFGPHGEIVGVLCAMTDTRRRWTKAERKCVTDHAYLLSEHVMLRAALETVKLIARERDMICSASVRHN